MKREHLTFNPGGFAMNKASHCRTCGKARGMSPIRDHFSINEIVRVSKHKELLRPDGFTYEADPQLIVHVGVWRNGGTCDDYYICDDCLRLGIRTAIDKLNEILG